MAEVSDYTQDPTCRICGVLYARHPRCQCCGLFCGPEHFHEEVTRYRGKKLCSSCIEEWPAMEEKVGHTVPWVEFWNRDKYYRVDGTAKKEVRG